MPIKSSGNPDLIRLRQYLDYNQETGVFTWKITKNWQAKAGVAAGSVHNCGYLQIGFEGKLYLYHRLAWFMYYGELNELDQIDHENKIRSDNRICNLRKATHEENCRNSKVRSHNISGLKGVKYDKRRNTYGARIVIDKKTTWLGAFDTAEEAHAAYCEAAKKLHGSFSSFT